MKQQTISDTHRQQLSYKNGGSRNANWRGDKVGRGALHNWLTYNYGKASRCVIGTGCKKRVYHWANISRQYKRDIKDFIELCAYHHRVFDRNNFTLKELFAYSLTENLNKQKEHEQYLIEMANKDVS
jgi:hypothetical protein